MDIIPNLRIARSGLQYQEAAQVLEQKSLMWPAAINAALAIEIYLKSFLAKDTWKDYPSGGKFKTFDLAERGHNFIELYNKIPSNHQEVLHEIISENDGLELVSELEKYQSVFFDARYPYEETAAMRIESGIIRLSESLKGAIDIILDPDR